MLRSIQHQNRRAAARNTQTCNESSTPTFAPFGRAVMTSPTFLDLFCGCGGFTLGMIRSGFRCLAAVDSDPVAIETLEANFAASNAGVPGIDHILQADLTQLRPQQLAQLIGSRSVDVIV